MLGNAMTTPGVPKVRLQRTEPMQIFDRLPYAVREALRYTTFTFSPAEAEDLLLRYRQSPREVAQFIREFDAELRRRFPQTLTQVKKEQ